MSSPPSASTSNNTRPPASNSSRVGATGSTHELNNNNNQKPALTRKRSSIQSNMSSLSVTNGSGHGSLHSNSSSSTTASGDDLNEERPSYSSADYERIRNTTLLFFLDRLYLASTEGKEARTLHDLSCLFGTKQFTKEMRQIVGASRNGLKKFLQSYPSLFHIEGDKVYLTQLKQDPVASQRDYNKEAVEYFKMKLLQFGTSLVPIKNLFGYRSQASQEVRHVSGKNTRDFKRFLRQNEDVFEILADEHVVLKSALAELESQGQTSLALEQSLQPLEADEAIVTDPYLNKQFAHLVEDCIRTMRTEELEAKRLEEKEVDEYKVTLEQLLERIRKHCQNELFLKMVKSQQDLKVFLRMHPKLFKRFKCDQGRDCVSLLSAQERRDLELAAQAHHQSMLQRQHSALERSQSQQQQQQQVSSNSSNEQHQHIPKSEASKSVSEQQTQQLVAEKRQQETVRTTREETQEARSLPPIQNNHQASSSSNGNQNNRPTASKSQISSSSSKTTTIRSQQQPSQTRTSQANQQLRATAPPFVPSKPPSRQNSALTSTSRTGQQHQHTAQTSNGTLTMRRSHSNLTSSRGNNNNQQPTTDYGSRRQPLQSSLSNAPAPIDQRQAIRSYLMKNNNNNSVGPQSSHHNLNWAQNNNNNNHQFGSNKSSATNASGLMQPQLHLRVTENELRARTVDIVREASNIITRIMTTTDAVAFDCKGFNLGFDGQITLIQFGYLPTKKADPMRSFDAMRAQEAQKGAPEDTKATRVKPEVCVFDLLTNPELAYCLKPLLESDKVVKIVHDVRNKSNALYVQFKIILNNVFDTQVANLVIQQQDTGKPAYKSRYISMGKLCEIYGDDELMKYRNIIKHKTRHATGNNGNQMGSSSLPSSSSSSRNSKDVNYWRARPLTRPMIFEATMDVYCLVGGIYQNLKSRLKPEYEPLFDQLNLEGVLARIKPDEIRSAKKERKIDLEVIDLKRKLYSDSTGPVVLSNREIRLLRHIDLTEEVRQKIQQCKKVAKKLERLDMKAAQLREQQEGGATVAAADSTGQQNSLSNTSTSQLSSMATNLDNELNQSLDGNLTSLAPSEMNAADFASKMDEFQATGMITNLMDSSMFDELKDKMIESSSLLESLEDDEDEAAECAAAAAVAATAVTATGSGHMSSSSLHSHHNGSDCACQCHRSSTDSGEAVSKSLEKLVATTAAASNQEVKGGNKLESFPPTSETTIASETQTPNMPDRSDAKSNDEQNSEIIKKDEQSEVGGEEMEEKERKQHDEDADSKSSLACDMAVQCDLLS